MLNFISRFRRTVLVGLTATALSMPVLAVAPTAAQNQAPEAQAVDRAAVVGTETDAKGRKIIMREGIYLAGDDRGFGWTKIRVKHAIFKKSIVGFVLKEPSGGDPRPGTDRRIYKALANKAECGPRGCFITATRELVAVVDSKQRTAPYHTVNLRGGRAGVITTYCENPNREQECPSWVNESVNASRSSEQNTSTETLWTYEPLTDQQLETYNERGQAAGVNVL